MKRQIMIWLSVFISTGVFILLAGCSEKGATPKTQTPVTGTTATPNVIPPSKVAGGAVATPVGKIAFMSGGGSIHVINADGTNEKRLASGWAPAWSPDGQKVAYHSGDGLYIVNTDGTGTVRVATASVTLTYYNEKLEARWSPDGKRLVYLTQESRGSTGFESLWSVNSDGSAPVNIAKGVMAGAPSFSPDGGRLAMVMCLDCVWDLSKNNDLIEQNIYIYTMNLDGTRKVKVSGAMYRSSYDLAWAPKGTKIAYISSTSLIVMDSDGNGTNKITIESSMGSESTIAWAPDGGRIAYTTYEQLLIANSDGTGKKELVRGVYIRWPSWSPDGQWLAIEMGNPAKVFTVKADGTGLKQLVLGSYPRFSPVAK